MDDECPNCGGPVRRYDPWYEPPENRYSECRACGYIEYDYDPFED